MEGRAQPIHPVIDCIFDEGMPVLLGKLRFIVNHVANRVTVLETSELAFPVSNS